MTLRRSNLPYVFSACLWGFLLLYTPSTRATAQDDYETAPWQQAVSLYEAGKMEEALQELLKKPTDTPAYFYNLGTVYYKLGQISRALAFLEKANRLEPHDSAIQQNLQLARTELGRLIGQERLDPASTPLESFVDNISLSEVRGAIGLVILVLSLLWLRSYLKSRDLKSTVLKPGSLICLLALAITLGLYLMERFAVVQAPAACVERLTVRSGPGERFVELSQLETGVKVRVTGQTANSTADSEEGSAWRQIRYSKDGIGWAKATSLLLL